MNRILLETFTRCAAARQVGSSVMLATVSLMIVGAALAMSQMSSSKSDTVATQAAQTANTAASQAAALAAAAGVAFVNGLSSSTLCSGSTGCSSGIYGSAALSGGASAQSASWWTSGNAHAFSYAGLNSTPLYAVEMVSCDGSSGATIYKITGRAVGNSSNTGFQNSNVVFYTKTVTKTWASATVVFYDYACNPSYIASSGRNYTFTIGGANNTSYNTSNFSPSNVGGEPYPIFTGTSGSITQVQLDLGSLSVGHGSTMNIVIKVNGVQKYSGSVTSGPPSGNSPNAFCYSGQYMNSSFTVPAISVNSGDTVTINGSGCVGNPSGSCSAGYQFQRARLVGTQAACPS